MESMNIVTVDMLPEDQSRQARAMRISETGNVADDNQARECQLERGASDEYGAAILQR